MADRLFENSLFYLKRFNCACSDITHTADLSIELGEYPRIVEIEFAEGYLGNKMPLFLRIKRAIQLILGKELWGHGWLIRPEDIDEMIEMLERARGSSVKITSANCPTAQWTPSFKIGHHS